MNIYIYIYIYLYIILTYIYKQCNIITTTDTEAVNPAYWNTPLHCSESSTYLTLPVSCTVNTLSYT